MSQPNSPTTKSDDPETILFDFNADTPPNAWRTQDDVVMGGRSDGHFEITEEGHGHFWGKVSLENNGGFSSIQTFFDSPRDLGEATSFQLRLRGDGKDYTFRVKGSEDQRYWHQFTFPTKVSEEWETISIPFSAMEAMHHGEPVDVPNFAGGQAVGLQLLIGNGVAEEFEMELDSVAVL